MARSRILEAFAENARVEEQLGEDGDTAVYANAAQRYAEEAVALAKHTQNRRLLAGAYIVRGMTAANDFFRSGMRRSNARPGPPHCCVPTIAIIFGKSSSL